MPTIAITAARDNLYKLVEQVNQTREPVIITNAKGENAVLLAEKDYLALQETLSLLGDKETYNRLLSEYNDADFVDIDEAIADVERDHR
ncbi:MAG: type II toxin-antitoxin system Phd/YefM family antitoxin [Bacilli bacterium]|nr:type II toxin-antitoxin system Phd/YefM family antitoxin [Bacilli bacterium]